MKIFLSSICFLCLLAPSFAQNDISIQMDWFGSNENIKIFFINDFDLTQSGDGPLLFWVIINNSAADIATIRLKLSVMILAPNA